ncbi:right-handed parallel beta-helix repeat-containing protein [Paenibacillus sp. GCM10012303]|uniref:right-handed parallel beta-helix repeat-containing protein n=1 Tax=Paenibacillus sp. GCM10012303 TaxID=3317340 RepID=UPI00361E247B
MHKRDINHEGDFKHERSRPEQHQFPAAAATNGITTIEAHTKTRVSRRKMLTMLGAAGVSLTAAGLLPAGALGPSTAYADKGGIPNHGAGNGNTGVSGSPPSPSGTSDCVIPMTLSQLRSYTPPQPNEQYYLTDPGHEGHFRYDPTDSSSPDNTGTVLVSSSGARFKRHIEGKTYNVTWFGAKGNGVNNDTPALQAAIDAIPPEGGTLYIPPAAAFYALETGGLWLSDRTNIHIFSSHAILKIQAGVPDIPKQQDSTYTTSVDNYSLLYLQNCTNMTIEGLQLNGNISNRTALASGESFQTCLKIKGCTNVNVRNCIITEAMTDGITVTGIYQFTPTRQVQVSKQILIDCCTVTKCRRNNVSLIAQDGVTMTNCLIDQAGIIQGTQPMVGIDVEPNPSWPRSSQNVILRNNRVTRSAGKYEISCGGSDQHHILIDGNLIHDSIGTGLNIETGKNQPLCTNVIVVNNTFTHTKYGLRIVGRNVELISNNLFVDNEQIGLFLYSSDGMLVTANKFIRNGVAGIFNSTSDASLKIRSLFITNNWFEDNASAAFASHGNSVKLSKYDASSLVVFDNNKQINTPAASPKMKGVLIDIDCNAVANGNVSRYLLDPDHPHDRFDGVGNVSLSI